MTNKAKARQRRRNSFLTAPADLRADTSSKSTQETMDSARRAWEGTTWPEAGSGRYQKLLDAEARDSSAIEGVTHTWELRKHAQGLRGLLEKPLTLEAMLEAHAVIMDGQARAEPGRLRSINVQVGNHMAPPQAQVPELLENLYRYVNESDDEPIIKAIFAHLQFETIHPFADGNGRTGRALINQILKTPIPLSIYVHSYRPSYYRVLDAGEWDNYAEYMLKGIELTCEYAWNKEPDRSPGMEAAAWRQNARRFDEEYKEFERRIRG